VDQGALLAGHVVVGHRFDAHPRRRLVTTLGQRPPQGVVGGGRMAVDADDDLAGTDGGGSEQGAVEHEVGRQLEQHLVLVARRLALAAIDHHHRAASLAHRPELSGRREGGPAPAAQP
jgi:hypothetical protein